MLSLMPEVDDGTVEQRGTPPTPNPLESTWDKAPTSTTVGGMQMPTSGGASNPTAAPTGTQLGPIIGAGLTDPAPTGAQTAASPTPLTIPQYQEINPEAGAHTVTLNKNASTGHFANWDQYFNANADTVARRGQGLLTKVKSDAQKAQAKQQALTNDFNAQADAGTPQFEQLHVTTDDDPAAGGDGAPSSTTNNPNGTQSKQQGLTIDGASASGVGQVGSQNPGGAAGGIGKAQVQQGLQSPGGPRTVSQTQARQMAADAQYTGPTSLADLQDYLDAVQYTHSVQQEALALGSSQYTDDQGNPVDPMAGGLQALLSQAYGPGVTGFDADLIGGGNRPAFDKAAKTFGDLDKVLAGRVDASKAKSDLAKTIAQGVAQDYQTMADHPDTTYHDAQVAKQHKAEVDKSLDKGDETFEKFSTPSSTFWGTEIAQGANPLSYVNRLINGRGSRGLESGMHDRDGSLAKTVDSLLGGDGTGSQRYLWGIEDLKNEGYTESDLRKAYSYLTPAEVQKVEAMDGKEAHDYLKALMDRIKGGWSPYSDPNWGKA